MIPLPQWEQNDERANEVVNANAHILQAFAAYAERSLDHDGLTFRLHGGPWGDFAHADVDFALSDNVSNYIVVDRATGVPSCSQTNTDWLNTVAYARVYLVPVAAAATTFDRATLQDHRTRAFGVWAPAAAPAASSIEHITLTVKTVAAEAVPLVTNIGYGGTITKVTTRCASGTATAEVTINGAGIGAPNAVSAAEANQDQADAFIAGADLGVLFTAPTACLMANVTITVQRS